MINSDRRPVSNRRPLLKSASTDVIISNHGPILGYSQIGVLSKLSYLIYRPVYTKFTIKNNFNDSFVFIIPPLPEGRWGGILFYVCPSFRPSKIFFIALFSVTVDGRNLIFLYTLNIYAHFSSHFSQQLLMAEI